MKFSLVYTSRRAHEIQKVLGAWLSRASAPERVEVVLGIDADYADGLRVAEGLNGKLIDLKGNLTEVKLAKNLGPFNCVAGWNAAAAMATGDVLIAIADDFDPPEGWDADLEKVGEAGWWERDHAVWVADGYSPDLMTLAICTARRYRRFGYLFYSGYESLFSDTEFTAVARQERVVIDARHLLFEHMHPDAGKRPKDSVDATHASSLRWRRGEALFNLRRDSGFPLDAGPVADLLEPTYADLEFAIYVQAIRDDLCLADVVERIIRDSGGKVKAVFVCCPDEYWGGKPQTDSDRAEVEDAVGYLQHAHQQVRIQAVRQEVAPHRIAGRSRIDVETSVRNAAINVIRGEGFQHILIADGDELWKDGLFARLRAFVAEFRPASVYTGMVPVIGLPGYPVEGAIDKATIYVGPGAWFTDCRGVSGHRHEITGHDVIHFTCTRRTTEEIVSKIRESGHADDPQYAMEEWIEKVLPNIRPGFAHRWGPENVGLHMFRPYQVWPSVRNWTTEEWKTLPPSARAHLAPPP